MPAVATGSTIALVTDRSQTAPTSRRAMPTTSHAVSPASRSQPGAEKTPRSSVGSISTYSSPPAPPPAAGSPPSRRRKRPRIIGI